MKVASLLAVSYSALATGKTVSGNSKGLNDGLAKTLPKAST